MTWEEWKKKCARKEAIAEPSEIHERSQGIEKPQKILYVNAMVEMNTGRILPTVVPWKDLPIEVKIFFKERLLAEKSE